jgi:Protein of unknown function (DUF1592)/Protein of unknown function (DUF1588)/Protein of unknown function (DUF1595)/Protein of unknown function (DUF1587)/Protein of unknown function (DUF1585)
MRYLTTKRTDRYRGDGMTKRTFTVLSALLLGVGLSLGLTVDTSARAQAPAGAAAAAPASGTMPVAKQNALVQQYCVPCHDDAQLTGGLSLQKFDAGHPDLHIITMMIGKLKAKEMPPSGMPRPDAATLSDFLETLSAEAVGAPMPSHAEASAAAPAAFKPIIVDFPHKGDYMSVATQNQLVHTICTQCHTDQRKPGGVSFEHFDLATATDHPELVEDMIAKLLAGMMPKASAPKRPDAPTLHALAVSLENRIDRAAAAHPDPGFRTFQRLNRVEYADSIRTMLGLTVDVSQWLPPDTMSHNFDNIANVQTFSPTLLQSYLDAADQISRLAVGDPHTTASATTYAASTTASQMDRVPGAPFGTRGGLSVVKVFPADGTYRFSVLFFAVPTGELYGSTVKGERMEVSIDGQRAAVFTINPRMSESDPHGLTVQTPDIEVKAGPHRVTAAFLKDFDGPIDDLLSPHRYTLADTQIGDGPGITTLPHVRDMTITGPFHVTGVSDTVSRQKIFICRPVTLAGETPCAAKIVTNLATEAYRRPVTPGELQALMNFYQLGRKQGDFESGVRMALQAILASPHFLFRLEREPVSVRPGQDYRIGDLALASRLSYFLWATPPDAELVKLAQAGRLHEPAVLDAQVKRMLQDPRSYALATRFAAQWLRLQDVDKVRPDALAYPQYDATLGEDMKQETEHFFDSIVKGDRNVMDLLTADYTYVNGPLAAFYGIPDVSGPQFRKVSLQGTHRRGILGEGSILVETSVADRSDPVLRGKWVLEVLLGQPPPPPPPGVNTDLDATASAVQNGKPLSVRQRMAEHRANPFCASCHSVIDPIGLSLENFDPTGHWRIKDNGVPVDASTTLYDGTKMDGLQGLVQAMLAHQTTFLNVFTENLMAYALGRRIHYYDMPTVRAIISRAGRDGNRFSSFVLGVVNSDAFRMSRAGALSADNSQPTSHGKKGF